MILAFLKYIILRVYHQNKAYQLKEELTLDIQIIKSGEGEVLLGVPAWVVVHLLEYVAHHVLLAPVLLDQPHVQVYLPEQPLGLLALPLTVFRLGLAGWPFGQHQLGAVELQPRCDFFMRYHRDVPALGTDFGDPLEEFRSLNGDNFFEDLCKGGKYLLFLCLGECPDLLRGEEGE